MSRSAIYAINTTPGTTINAGGTYPVTQVARRYGQDIASNGSGITCKTAGYYKLNAVVTIEAEEAGVMTANLVNNGTPIPGASAAVTAAAGDTVSLALDAIARVACCGNPADITIQMSGAGTTVNAEITAFKL